MTILLIEPIGDALSKIWRKNVDNGEAWTDIHLRELSYKVGSIFIQNGDLWRHCRKVWRQNEIGMTSL